MSLDLNRFAHLVADGKAKQAHPMFVALLGMIESNFDIEPANKTTFYNLSAVLEKHLLNPKLKLNEKDFEVIAIFMPGLIGLMEAGGYTPTETKNKKKRLLLSSLETFPEKERNIALIASMLTATSMTEESETKRDALLEDPDLLNHPDQKLSTMVMPRMATSFMNISYARTPKRNQPKAGMMKHFRAWAERHKMRDLDVENKPKTDKPKLLVMAEIMREGHAMFRCYAPALMQLKKRFDVMLMAGPDMDEKAAEIGHRAVKTKYDFLDPTTMYKCWKEIKEFGPDVILFPSLGMRPWTTALSSFRLAPIQAMLPGHPSSSFSPNMDFFIIPEDTCGDVETYSEKVVKLKPGGNPFLLPEAIPDVPEVNHKDEVVKIAIPANAMKLNGTFLQSCLRIAHRSPKPISFHFFPNQIGIQYRAMEAFIKKNVMNAKVYERTSYQQYLKNLGRCHMHLVPFPFGGSNSNIDSMFMAQPMVNLWGPEPAQACDRGLFGRVGFDSEFTVYTQGQYEARALELIEDPDERESIRAHFLGMSRPEIIERVTGTHLGGGVEDITETLWRLHEERI